MPSDRPILVGRSGHKTSSLDVNLWPDMSVSRRHALIWFDGEGWHIEDLKVLTGLCWVIAIFEASTPYVLLLGPKYSSRTVLMLTARAPESGESAQASADVPSAD